MEQSFYPYIMAFGWVGALLMLGTFIRAKFKFFQTLLFPANLIGGLIGFILMQFDLVGLPTSNGWQTIPTSAFNMITFHLFAFGFVGIGFLKNTNNKLKDVGGATMRGAWLHSWLFGILFAIQAVIGYSVFYLWKMFGNGDFAEVNGYLLGAGFTQGPGQTQAYGTIWESTYGIASSIDVGLAFAAVGFLVAGIIGVPLARYGLRNCWLKDNGECLELPPELLVGIMDKNNQKPCAYTTTHSANIDSIAFHLSLMFFAYALAYGFGLFWVTYMPVVAMRPLGFGFMFNWGMVIALLIRKMMEKIKIDHLLDPGTSRSLTGTTVDFMICSVFLGVEPVALHDVFVPFFIAITLGSIATLAICLWFGRRAPEFGFERMLAIFGSCTGTGASGLMLLRIVDPEFKTTVAVEIGVVAPITVIICSPIGWGMPFAPLEGFPIFWIFVGVIVVFPIMMFITRLVKKPSF